MPSHLRLVADDGVTMPEPPEMPVIICGSRTFQDVTAIEVVIRGLAAAAEVRGGQLVVIEGEARGADVIARAEAERLGLKVARFPADWDAHGRGAGHIRNQEMLDQRPGMVVAFIDKPLEESRGTHDMVRRARAAGVPTYVVQVQS